MSVDCGEEEEMSFSLPLLLHILWKIWRGEKKSHGRPQDFRKGEEGKSVKMFRKSVCREIKVQKNVRFLIYYQEKL